MSSEATPGAWHIDPGKTSHTSICLWRDASDGREFRRVKWEDAAAAPTMRDALRDIANGRVTGENAAALARMVLGSIGGAK